MSSFGRFVLPHIRFNRDMTLANIVRVHLSVSSRYLDTKGRERSESQRCLNSEETEQMYSKNLSV